MLKSSGFLDTSTEGDIKYILIFKKHPKNSGIQPCSYQYYKSLLSFYYYRNIILYSKLISLGDCEKNV